jgi:hypothetical protein
MFISKLNTDFDKDWRYVKDNPSKQNFGKNIKYIQYITNLIWCTTCIHFFH